MKVEKNTDSGYNCSVERRDDIASRRENLAILLRLRPTNKSAKRKKIEIHIPKVLEK